MFLAVGMDANNQILPIAYGLNGKTQNDMWWATCKAYTLNDFQHHLNILVKHRPDVLQTLNHIPPEKWTRAFAQCNRYNYMTSNSAESVNSLSVQARKLSITEVLDIFTDVTQRCQWAVHSFRSEVHRATYAESVYHIPDPLNWKIPEDFSEIATPHMNKIQAGRPPENKRIPSKGEDSRPRECSRCHAIGHNRYRCRTPLSSQFSSSSRSIKQTHFVNSENFHDYIIENTMSTTQKSEKFEYNLKEF
ncbi:hypothetical protein QVD17_38076 [Tagetes erecta]|uniref:Mutator-like transposase n=1 Tax=Tagetes erecta TaxID=13708 RepID=A0AAD8NKD6_TARER|nr:hypothetical protein QVD17_38076 [Tagetes erecta]